MKGLSDDEGAEGVEISPSMSIAKSCLTLLRGYIRLEDGSETVHHSISPIELVLNATLDRW